MLFQYRMVPAVLQKGQPVIVAATEGDGTLDLYINVPGTDPRHYPEHRIGTITKWQLREGTGDFEDTHTLSTLEWDFKHTITGLSPETTYTYRVRAEIDGVFYPESSIEVTTPPLILNAQVVQESVTRNGPSSVNLSWRSPVSTLSEGSSWTAFNWNTSSRVTLEATRMTVLDKDGNPEPNGRWTAVMSDLEVGRAFPTNFYIQGQHERNFGPRSNLQRFHLTTPKTIPPAPELTVFSSDAGLTLAMYVAFNKSKHAPILNYEYSVVPAGTAASWRSFPSLVESHPHVIQRTSYQTTVGGLTNGADYDCQVRAVTNMGTTDPSSVVSGTPRAMDPPTKVWDLEAVDAGNSSLLVSFEPPWGGYSDIQYSTDGNTWAVVGLKAPYPIGHHLTGLTAGNEVNVSVRAINAGGAGPVETVKATPTDLNPVGNLAVTYDMNGVNLAFDAPANVVDPLTYEYRVRWGSGYFRDWVDAGTSRNIDVDLPPGNTFSFEVRWNTDSVVGPAAFGQVRVPWRVVNN